jgi:glutathionyl-hydroquinone reductase
MGKLIAGQWRRDGVEKYLEDGALRRPPSLFRNWIGLIDADKAPVFPAEAGRYHLYVSLACPGRIARSSCAA